MKKCQAHECILEADESGLCWIHQYKKAMKMTSSANGLYRTTDIAKLEKYGETDSFPEAFDPDGEGFFK